MSTNRYLVHINIGFCAYHRSYLQWSPVTKGNKPPADDHPSKFVFRQTGKTERKSAERTARCRRRKRLDEMFPKPPRSL